MQADNSFNQVISAARHLSSHYERHGLRGVENFPVLVDTGGDELVGAFVVDSSQCSVGSRSPAKLRYDIKGLSGVALCIRRRGNALSYHSMQSTPNVLFLWQARTGEEVDMFALHYRRRSKELIRDDEFFPLADGDRFIIRRKSHEVRTLAVYLPKGVASSAGEMDDFPARASVHDKIKASKSRRVVHRFLTNHGSLQRTKH